MKKITKYLSAALLLVIANSCLKEGELKQPYKGYQPMDINDGWTLSDPQSENIDPAALDQVYKDVYADDEMWMTKSLLVFRHGKLVAESYLKDDADRTRQDAIWSCTKQITVIITGIAIDQGFIGNVTDPVGDYLPDYISRHPDKAGITLEMLLMMKSGSSFDNGTQSDIFREHKADNSIEYVLGRTAGVAQAALHRRPRYSLPGRLGLFPASGYFSGPRTQPTVRIESVPTMAAPS